MKTWVTHFWERIRTSFWFVPSLLSAGAVLLASLMLELDREWENALTSTFPSLETASASGTRELISTAATATLSLAGITFSGVLVAMTLASSQFGPRLLRNFIRARSTQLTLGMLLSTFVYCLLVLRGIRSREEVEFVPHLAALVGFLNTLLSLGFFIFFIHRISTSLQADQVAANVFAELRQAIDQFFPEGRETDASEEEAEAESEDWKDLEDETPLLAKEDGYLLAIDMETLVERCADHDLRCRVLKRPGHFLVKGTPILGIPGKASLEDEVEESMIDCFLSGSLRTPEQDFEFEILQLVEVALRALSPGINDPFTAITCIDFLGAANSTIARRKLPQQVYHDGNGVPRVHSHPISFESALDASFNQLRQTASAKPDIVIRLLEALTNIQRCCLTDAQRKAVRKHAHLIEADSRRTEMNELDRQEIMDRMEPFSDDDHPSEK